MQLAEQNRRRATQRRVAAKELTDANATMSHFLGTRRRAWMTDAASISSPSSGRAVQPPQLNLGMRGASTGSRPNAFEGSGGGNPSTHSLDQPFNRFPSGRNHDAPAIDEGRSWISPSRDPLRKRPAGACEADLSPRRRTAPQHTAPLQQGPNQPTMEFTAAANAVSHLQPADVPQSRKLVNLTMKKLNAFEAETGTLGRADLQIIFMLRKACNQPDLFYLFLHQVLCLLISSPTQLSLIAFGRNEIAGLNLINLIILSSPQLSAGTLSFCSMLPAPLELVINHAVFRDTIRQVAVFLNRFATGWDPMRAKSFQRGSPPFVDELCEEFEFHSPVLQKLLFSSIHIQLGATNSVPWAREALRLFDNNLAEHEARRMNDAGSERRHPSVVVAEQRLLHESYNVLRREAVNSPVPTAPAEQLMGVIQPFLPPSVSGATANRSHNMPFSWRRASASIPYSGSCQQPSLPQTPWPRSHSVHDHRSPDPSLRSRIPQSFDSANPAQYTHRQQSGGLWDPSANGASRVVPPQDYTFPQQAFPLQDFLPGSSPADHRPTFDLSLPSAEQESSGRMFPPAPVQCLPLAVDRNAVAQITGRTGAQLPPQHRDPCAMSSAGPLAPNDIRTQITRYTGRQPPPQQGHPNVLFSEGPLAPSDVRTQITGHGSRQPPSQQSHPSAPSSEGPLAPSDVRPMIRPDSCEVLTSIPFFPPLGCVPIQTSNPDPGRVALHQAYLQSPVAAKVNAIGQRSDDLRLYQFISAFALPPTAIDRGSPLFDQTFSISNVAFSKKAVDITGSDGRPQRLVCDGCLQYRLRLVELDCETRSLEEADWVTKDTSWPPSAFLVVNDVDIDLRRKYHHGKDLPANLTTLVREGSNNITIAFLTDPTNKAPPKGYAVAVEVVEVGDQAYLDSAPTSLSFDDSLRSITQSLARPAGTALTQNESNGNDDEVQILDRHLSIDLVDPFTATIFSSLPVRGKTCTHRECFDLQTFFQTRKSSRNNRHYHNQMAKHDSSPTSPDEWRCPICKRDARPGSLIVDEFLKGVRDSLVKSGSASDARAILVAADGSWKVKREERMRPPAERRNTQTSHAFSSKPRELHSPSTTTRTIPASSTKTRTTTTLAPGPPPGLGSTSAPVTPGQTKHIPRRSLTEVIEIDDD